MNGDTVLAWWSDYQIVNGLGLYLKYDGSESKVEQQGYYTEKDYTSAFPIKSFRIFDMSTNSP